MVFSLRHYAIAPYCTITPLRHCAITPLRHYAFTPLRHYAITALRLCVDLAGLISRFCVGIRGWSFHINVLIGECDKTQFGDPLTSQTSFPGYARASVDGLFVLKF
jgi:hypothetical protein